MLKKSVWRRATIGHRAVFLALGVGLAAPWGLPFAAPPSEVELGFASRVDHRLAIPDDEVRRYATHLRTVLAAAGLGSLPPQYVLLVDRNAQTQAALLYWKSPEGDLDLVGAVAVSTGLPGTFDHFLTPVGVFAHTLENPDFRALGTRNELGIRGYGERGMRVYDFGWQLALRGWGDNAPSTMRLQMHATDPDLLEPLLGIAHSKGCIRIPASFNRFLDHYGILDADYDAAPPGDRRLWVLASDREPTSWPGRYLVVMDSERVQRPAWAPLPTGQAKVKPLTAPAPALAESEVAAIPAQACGGEGVP